VVTAVPLSVRFGELDLKTLILEVSEGESSQLQKSLLPTKKDPLDCDLLRHLFALVGGEENQQDTKGWHSRVQRSSSFLLSPPPQIRCNFVRLVGKKDRLSHPLPFIHLLGHNNRKLLLRTTMSTSRTCSSCTNDLTRADFSKNQWQKGSNAKCKGCIRNPPPKKEPENPVPETSPSPELREPAEDVVKKEEEEQAAAAAAAAAAEKGRFAAILNFRWGYKILYNLTCALIFVLPPLNDRTY